MLKPRTTAVLFALFAVSTVYGGLLTYGPGTVPAIPDGFGGGVDGGVVTSDILVPVDQNFTINPGNAITLSLTGWSHTYMSDLILTLTGPGGITMTFDNRGGSNCIMLPGNTYNFNSGNSFTLDGSCGGNFEPGGDYMTDDPGLSAAWAGVNIAGSTWTLSAKDVGAGDTQVDPAAWSITFDTAGINADTSTPEPSTFGLLAGALSLGAYLRRRRA